MSLSPQPEASLQSAPPVWDESGAPPIDLLPIMQAILQRWPFFAWLSVLGFALAYAASFLVTPQFQAKAVFLPPTQHSAASDSPLAALIVPTRSNLYPGLLTSNSVVDDVIGQLDLQRVFQAKTLLRTRTTLRSMTTVSSDASEFYTIAVLHQDPALSKRIADAYLMAMARLSTRLAVDQATQQREVYQQQLDHEKAELAKAESALKQAQEAAGVVSAATQTQTGLSAIEQLRAQIGAAQVSLSALLQGETEQAPAVVRLRSQIGTLSAQLQHMESGSGGGAGGSISASRAPQINLDFVRLQREVQFHQTTFEIMTRQFENARIQQTSAAPGVQIVDYPELPTQKATPRRSIYALVGAVLGFLLAFALILIHDRYRAVKADPESAGILHTLGRSVATPTWRP